MGLVNKANNSGEMEGRRCVGGQETGADTGTIGGKKRSSLMATNVLGGEKVISSRK